MKTNYLHKIQTGLAVILVAAACTSCSDIWDNHYENMEGNSATQSLWMSIHAEPELEPFARVLEECGYKNRLDGKQTFTVWAPLITEQAADSLISIYKKDKANKIKDEDNQAIVQFVENHVALYNTSVSSITHDSIMMLNGKYMLLTPNSFGDTRMTSTNYHATNGVLHKVDRKQSYFPNVWEYLKLTPSVDSVAAFIRSFDEYYFDAQASVPGGVIDGETVYLDSVTHYYNSLFSALGYINREDSTYWMMAPTNELWNDLYNQYKTYFVYDEKTKNRDSLQNVIAKQAIITDLVFNMRRQGSVNDSLRSTAHNQRTPDYHVFHTPFASGGILNGLDSVVCSNGSVFLMNDTRIDPTQSFMLPIKVEAENEINRKDSLTIDPLPVRIMKTDTVFKISQNRFLEVVPATTSSNPIVVFTIPNILSNAYYDIYCVFVPAIAYNEKASELDRLPCKFRASLAYNRINGVNTSTSLKGNGSSTNLTTIPNVLDTVLLTNDFQFPATTFGQDNTKVKLEIKSVVSSKETSQYSRTMRIDCIILKPRMEATKTEN